ncbi:alpha/beta hydrolase [Streptomyces sp. S.PNR 29]|uniref:alpha/beta fold hydrolase n=1 Tax=Streptomyces sp. S.PNR 29 TaxID=2973805 RepID=UPI0025B06172|nr:alpha/beta hydrolase [Streptomyces sp. S.PNR 29]MDN0200595.1 alpha/beta hydrolase [Streptomyces sp. S.PNR 29]
MTDPHYDVRGGGPVLLVIPGGAGHPMGLDGMTEVLAERFTVVTYDPLGLAHGRLGLPVVEQRVQEWSEGACRVLDTVPGGEESAYVLGFSSGGIAALDLLARHPERVRHLVAHEPPVVGVLPDGARQQARFREVYDTYRAAGLRAAGARLAAVLEEREPEADQEPRPVSRAEESSSPLALFLAHVLRPFSSYVPELDAPAARLTLAAGADSRGQLLYRTATFLAERTGAGFAEFPGGHLGAAEHPRAFADRLLAALDLSGRR